MKRMSFLGLLVNVNRSILRAISVFLIIAFVLITFRFVAKANSYNCYSIGGRHCPCQPLESDYCKNNPCEHIDKDRVWIWVDRDCPDNFAKPQDWDSLKCGDIYKYHCNGESIEENPHKDDPDWWTDGYLPEPCVVCDTDHPLMFSPKEKYEEIKGSPFPIPPVLKPELLIRDCLDDNGLVPSWTPSNPKCPVWTSSPDIYIDYSDDAWPDKPGDPSKLTTRVKNSGNKDAEGVKVIFYEVIIIMPENSIDDPLAPYRWPLIFNPEEARMIGKSELLNIPSGEYKTAYIAWDIPSHPGSSWLYIVSVVSHPEDPPKNFPIYLYDDNNIAGHFFRTGQLPPQDVKLKRPWIQPWEPVILFSGWSVVLLIGFRYLWLKRKGAKLSKR